MTLSHYLIELHVLLFSSRMLDAWKRLASGKNDEEAVTNFKSVLMCLIFMTRASVELNELFVRLFQFSRP